MRPASSITEPSPWIQSLPSWPKMHVVVGAAGDDVSRPTCLASAVVAVVEQRDRSLLVGGVRDQPARLAPTWATAVGIVDHVAEQRAEPLD